MHGTHKATFNYTKYLNDLSDIYLIRVAKILVILFLKIYLAKKFLQNRLIFLGITEVIFLIEITK